MNEQLKPFVDELGTLLAHKTVLELREKTIKNALIAVGAGAYDGDRYRATVSIFDKETLPIADARDKLIELGVDGRWFAKHTRTTTQACVKCVARNSGE